MQLEILFQDQHFVAVNKPANILVHRSPIDRHEQVFILQLLRDQIGQRVYPLHRLDKPTSGVLVFGLSPEAASAYDTSASHFTPQKRYLAIVRGHTKTSDTIDHPLKEIEDKHDPDTQNPSTQDAITHYQTIAHTEIDAAIDKYPTSRYSLLDLKLETGRRHQIRRHLKHISHPIIGDVNYGKGTHNRYFREQLHIHGLLLHAHALTFLHPFTDQHIEIKAPLDSRMTLAMNLFPHLPEDIMVLIK